MFYKCALCDPAYIIGLHFNLSAMEIYCYNPNSHTDVTHHTVRHYSFSLLDIH